MDKEMQTDDFTPTLLSAELLVKCGFDFIPDWDHPDGTKIDAWVKTPYFLIESWDSKGNPNGYILCHYANGVLAEGSSPLLCLDQLQFNLALQEELNKNL